MRGDGASRPRLAIHVKARRHVVDGKTIITLHLPDDERVMIVGEREWTVLRCADGTRDIEGIEAAVSNRGRSTSREHIRSFFEELERAGMIVDGIEATRDEILLETEATGAQVVTEQQLAALAEPLRDRPLDLPRNTTFRCDSRGACCKMFPTVLFSPAEALKARATCPDLPEESPSQDTLFMPERGARSSGLASSRGVHAATSVDGRCVFFDEDHGCALHHRGGPSNKPLGCQMFPLTFVDDGEAIRVSLTADCACVFETLDVVEAPPLLPPGVETGGDLDPGIYVHRLSEQLPLTSAASADRSDIVAWSRRVLRVFESTGSHEDLASTFWALAGIVEKAGLDLAAIGEVPGASRPSRAALEPWLIALKAKAARRLERDRGWRSPRDLAFVTASWIDLACEALLDGGEEAPTTATSLRRRDEGLYFKLTVHGHQLLDGRPLATSLRDRAIRLLVAATLPSICQPEEVRADARGALAHPLALVEPLMRGHGLMWFTDEL